MIVLDVLKQEMAIWKPRILSLIEQFPEETEGQIGWRLVEEISATRAALLKHIFDKENGVNGRLSIQTDPHFYRDSESLVSAMAIRSSSANLRPI